MTNFTISKEWFNEIESKVPHANAYTYTDEYFDIEMIEVDILDEEKFIEVSKELGWMV